MPVPEPLIDFRPSKTVRLRAGMGGVAVGDHERPAAEAVGAGAGLHVGDRVGAVAGGRDARGDVGEALVDDRAVVDGRWR